MKNLWNDQEAKKFENNPLQMRVYTSRLLGQEPSLVLHGGGNTSVKANHKNLFGETDELLYVKGSGWDLATIEAAGFAPVQMSTLLKMAKLEKLSDTDMVRVQKSAMIDPNAPAPSVEAILHAIIPYKFVDHTHADAIVAITNTANGPEAIQKILGPRILYIPYVMPGFILARKVYEMTHDLDWKKYDGMVLLHHGIFSFSDSAKESYERMIQFVSQAEDYLKEKKSFEIPADGAAPEENLLELAEIRKSISQMRGAAVVACVNKSPEALSFTRRANIESIASRGPLTPDHVIHTKRIPWMIGYKAGEKISDGLSHFEAEYKKYFDRNVEALKQQGLAEASQLKCLETSPRWAVWKNHGVLSFGTSAKMSHVVGDIIRHTMKGEQWAENLGGWKALPEKDIFEVEYWELEQAKLKKSGGALPLQGKVALVTGAASGIGRACVNSLKAQGAAVVAVDINADVKNHWKSADVLTIACDLTDPKNVDQMIASTVQTYGGLDIVVANAGIFPSSKTIESMDSDLWIKTLNVNLTSQMYLFRACAPFLKLGIDPTIIVLASKNVIAPGPGAGAYSVSKAGLTQLARVAALELGAFGVRVNVLHPHAVMDTGIWSDDILAARAKHYKMTVDEYKKNNLMAVELQSKDVSDLVAQMAGPLYKKITGAQITMDGGSDRTI